MYYYYYFSFYICIYSYFHSFVQSESLLAFCLENVILTNAIAYGMFKESNLMTSTGINPNS